MNKGISLFKRLLGGNLAVSFCALLVGCCVSILIYFTSINNNRIWISITAALALTLLLRIIYNFIIQPIMANLTKAQIITILLVSAFLSLLLILNISMDHHFPAPFNDGVLLSLILYPIAFTIFFFLVAGYYGPFPYTSALIMFWFLVLLVYWPGIIGNVNIREIGKLEEGIIDNWHPVIFTLLLGSFTKLFSTMASFLIFQIVCMGAAIGWGFSFLESKGADRRVLWLLAIVIAILPSNFISLITLTDDIIYSIALLAITIVTIKIVFSKGAWLKETKNIIGFVLLGLLASTLRYNGIPAVGFTLVCLLIFFPSIWKNILAVIGMITIGYFLINGPLFDIIGVERVAEGHFDNILLHHISAHVEADTPLEDNQRAYLDSLYPIGEWSYSCCMNSEMLRKTGFNEETFHANSALNKKISLDLLIKDPVVNLRHLLCASDMVWNVSGNCGILYPRMEQTKGIYYWTRSNSSEYVEDSKFPELVDPLSRLRIAIDNNKLLNTLIWRPALYLYLAILSVMVFIFRNRIKGSLIILSPLIGQSAFLLAFNRQQNFRYQFCAVIIGLFLLGLTVIPKRSK